MNLPIAARRNITIAGSLLALVCVVSLPLLWFAGYLVNSQTRQIDRIGIASTLAIARNVAAATDELLDTSKAALSQLAERVVVGPDGTPACDPLLLESRAFMPRVLNVAVIGMDGTLACSTLSVPEDLFRPIDKYPWLAAALRERKAILAGPFNGPVSGQWITTYTYPVVRGDNGAVAAVVLSIDALDFQPVMRQAGVAPGWIAGILDREGVLVSRSRDPQKWIGRSIPVEMQQILGSSEESGHIAVRGIDGVDRLYGVVRIPETPWLAFAGIDAEVVREGQRRSTGTLVVLGAVVVILAAVAAFVVSREISRPIRAMAEAARDRAAGQRYRRAPVSGPREVREFAAEFNRMVEVRERAEDENRELATRARRLSHRLEMQEQSERRRINSELHDRVGQHLSILSLSLDTVRAQLAAGAVSAVQRPLDEASALLRSTIAEVRNVMADLRPPALDDYGLVAGLRMHIASMAKTTGLAIALDAGERVPRLSITAETALFRIAQEALTNAAKHSGAKSVRVHVSCSEGILKLAVSDDGCGFETANLDENHGAWGLATMRERAEAIGATLRLTSQPGDGTTVSVEVDSHGPTEAPQP